jgi:hypothetical protein
VQGIRDGKLDLAKYLAEDVAAFDPAYPDPLATFAIPSEPRVAVQKPYGN